MKLEFSGKTYAGSDPVTGKSISAKAGDVVEVSDAKAKQLLKDYPKDWKEPGKKEDKPAKEEHKPKDERPPVSEAIIDLPPAAKKAEQPAAQEPKHTAWRPTKTKAKAKKRR